MNSFRGSKGLMGEIITQRSIISNIGQSIYSNQKSQGFHGTLKT